MGQRPADVVRSERLATRRKEVRRAGRRRRRRVSFASVVLVGLATGGWFLARSSLFALEGIEVTGARLLTPAEIVQASGLHDGQSMLGLHTERVRERIANLPLVRSVRVLRIPTSRIRIDIVERAPAFVLETVESRWLMDTDGMVLGVADGSSSFPTIRVDDELSADTGDRLVVTEVRDAIALWTALPRTLRAGHPTIDAGALTGLTLDRPDLVIRFGTVEQLAQKLGSVRLVLDRVRRMGRHVKMLDVRSPERPAARLG